MPPKPGKQDQMILVLEKIHKELRAMRILMSTGQTVDRDGETDEEMEKEVMEEQEASTAALNELVFPDDPMAPRDPEMSRDQRGF